MNCPTPERREQHCHAGSQSSAERLGGRPKQIAVQNRAANEYIWQETSLQMRSLFNRMMRSTFATVLLVFLTGASAIAGFVLWRSGAAQLSMTRSANASVGISEAINPIDVSVIDGDTIRARGKTIRLQGFDAPETGARAQCRRERELGDRATSQLRVLIAGGGLTLRLLPCPCAADTQGTQDCNDGRACGELRSYGRDIGVLMIQYVLARPHVCSASSCPPRAPWC